VRRFKLEPKLIAKAKLTPRQVQALEFYDGKNYGYRSVARELDTSRDNARYLVREGLRKIEKALR
jgi:transcriptional regulator